MPRIKIELPDSFPFSCQIPVRITDLNYGGHVGNDAILTLVHEARLQFLNNLGYSEMDLSGSGMIMADAAIEFRSELFYGEPVEISVAANEFSKYGFDLVYKIEKLMKDERKLVAIVKTGMLCFDYQKKKVCSVPDEARKKLESL